MAPFFQKALQGVHSGVREGSRVPKWLSNGAPGCQKRVPRTPKWRVLGANLFACTVRVRTQTVRLTCWCRHSWTWFPHALVGTVAATALAHWIYIYIWLCPKTLWLLRFKITALVPIRSLRSYTFLQCFQFFSYVPIRSYCVPTRSASDFEKLLFVFIRSYTFRSSSYAFLHMICKKLLDLYTFLYVPAGRM